MDIGMDMDRYNENSDRDFALGYGLDSSSGKAKRKVRSRAKTVSQVKNKKDSELKLGSSAFLDKAWKVGYRAAQSSVPESRNPFFSGSSEYELWIEGWWSGFYEK